MKPSLKAKIKIETRTPSSVRRDKKKLRIIPLGGVEEIGKNMMIIEYDQDIIVIDMGFMFPNEDMLGIDYVIPETSYLQKNRKKIKGVVISHGHMDHTGAIPYILKKLGNPRIWGTRLTIALIRQRLEEFKLSRYAKLSLFNPDRPLILGGFKLEFFRVAHNIPDGVGMVIHTPLGLIIYTGDFKFDPTPVDQKPTDIKKINKICKKGCLVLCSDSSNAEYPGRSISEKELEATINKIFDQARGRIIIATFSSLISRIQQIINASVKHKRKVAFSGLSMEKNVGVATRLGYLKIPKNTFIRLRQTKQVPESRLTIISAGSQGQEMSALGRMSKGEHKEIKIQKGDTVILSSSPIPGNERAIHNIMNRLIDKGAKVIYNRLLDIHTSGHGRREDLKRMIQLTKPQYFIPTHGEHYMLVQHGEIAENCGVNPKNIFMMYNGQILEITSQGAKISKSRLPADYVMVDGLGVGDVGNVVLRDRQVMAQDGMFVVIVTVDNETGKLIGEPDIISRGFIYMKGSNKLIQETKQKVKEIINSHTQNTNNWSPVKSRIRDEIGLFLFKKTERRPMVLPVVIQV